MKAAPSRHALMETGVQEIRQITWTIVDSDSSTGAVLAIEMIDIKSTKVLWLSCSDNCS